jgi:hypothetical protein
VDKFVSPATREHAIMEEKFSVRCVPGLYNEDYAVMRSEKLVAEAWGQFGNLEEGERPPFEAAAKQRLVKTGKILCML